METDFSVTNILVNVRDVLPTVRLVSELVETSVPLVLPDSLMLLYVFMKNLIVLNLNTFR